MFPCEKHGNTMCSICILGRMQGTFVIKPIAECPDCHCPLDEHFEPQANILAEQGYDMEHVYCAGKLNYCGSCGDCYK